MAHACRAPHSANRTDCGRSLLFRGGRERHSCVLAAAWGYLALLVHLGIVRFFVAIPTEFDRSRLYKKKRRIGWALLLLWCAYLL